MISFLTQSVARAVLVPREAKMNETKTIKKSRKDHKCYQCGEIIPKGSSYKRHYGVYDSLFFDNCNHLECWDLWLAFNEDALEHDEWFNIYEDDMSHLQVPISFNDYKMEIRNKYNLEE